jgi:diguanylate cyclase (GGDEF)-like protein
MAVVSEIEPMQDPYENGKLRRHYRSLVLVLAFTVVLLIGWIRSLTGTELAFSFFYLLPIVTVTWLGGVRWGIAISFVSAATWLLADLFMIESFSNPFIPLINEFFRFTIFLFIVLMVTRYRKILETQKELAMRDSLTGIANRRAFLQLAQTELDRSRRYQHPFSVMLVDLDNFKQINDHFGHHTGDRLLLAVVDTIKHHVRAIDIVARLGGDEFVVLLVRTEGKSAYLVARKLQKQLLDIMESNKWQVTFSIGLATYHSAPNSINETVKAADELMYQVKHNGKNNIKHAVIT